MTLKEFERLNEEYDKKMQKAFRVAVGGRRTSQKLRGTGADKQEAIRFMEIDFNVGRIK